MSHFLLTSFSVVVYIVFLLSIKSSSTKSPLRTRLLHSCVIARQDMADLASLDRERERERERSLLTIK